MTVYFTCTRLVHRRSWHGPPPFFFSNFLFTNLFSIKYLYFFIISSLFPYFNLFVSIIFIQSYVNIKLHVSTHRYLWTGPHVAPFFFFFFFFFKILPPPPFFFFFKEKKEKIKRGGGNILKKKRRTKSNIGSCPQEPVVSTLLLNLI